MGSQNSTGQSQGRGLPHCVCTHAHTRNGKLCLLWKHETIYLSSLFVWGYSVGPGFILGSGETDVSRRAKESRKTPTFCSLQVWKRSKKLQKHALKNHWWALKWMSVQPMQRTHCFRSPYFFDINGLLNKPKQLLSFVSLHLRPRTARSRHLVLFWKTKLRAFPVSIHGPEIFNVSVHMSHASSYEIYK